MINNYNISNLKIYVISLKTKEEYIKSNNYKSLSNLNHKIILSKGIILNKQQCEKYFIYAKSAIGITLAHLKVWKNIKRKMDNLNKLSTLSNYSIILEDDTILKFDKNKFFEEIKYIINNFTFDIYKIHSDFNNGFTSMAAYIINNNTVNNILSNYKIYLGHLDFDLYILKLLNKITLLTHSHNLFITNENESTNRKDKYNVLKLLDNIKLSERSDKNLRHFISFKVFRIFDYETIVFELILFILLIISIIFKLKYLFLIVIILLII